MHASLIRDYLVCAGCKAGALEVVPFDVRGEELENAVVSCGVCGLWYRLERGLLELLVPALRDAARTERFRRQFAARWDGWEQRGAPSAPGAGDPHKLGQIEFYDQDALPYETHMLQLSFWKAFDRTYLRQIEDFSAGRAMMLEIGGGTGRLSLPLSAAFRLILSFDISESMVRTAMQKRAQRGDAATHVHYFVADAENIPVRSASVDVAIFSGILHHVARPDAVIAEMARTLVAGGRFMGQENNRSVFRPVFDALMRMRPLWSEKAHEDHFTLSERELREWMAQANVTSRVWTSVFLPPHLFNLLPERQAERLLAGSDSVCRSLPWLRSQGGLVLFSGEKPAQLTS